MRGKLTGKRRNSPLIMAARRGLVRVAWWRRSCGSGGKRERGVEGLYRGQKRVQLRAESYRIRLGFARVRASVRVLHGELGEMTGGVRLAA